MNVVDIIFICFFSFAFLIGYIRGLIKTLLSLAGLIVGATIGFVFLPRFIRIFTTSFEVLSSALGILLGALIGAFFFGLASKIISIALIPLGPFKILDKLFGGIFNVIVITITLFVSVNMFSDVTLTSVTKYTDKSKVMSFMKRTDFIYADKITKKLSEWVSNSPIRDIATRIVDDVFSEPPLESKRSKHDGIITNAVNIDNYNFSVVRVQAFASECDFYASGTGFYVKKNIVVTATPIISGADEIKIHNTLTGEKYDAFVVGFNEELGLAALQVEESGRSLSILNDTESIGKEALVVGYLRGGERRSVSAILGNVISMSGIVSDGIDVKRNILVFRGAVHYDNIGAPIMNANKQIVGMFFAKDKHNVNIGFALPSTTIHSFLMNVGNEVVGTGGCFTNLP